MMPGAGDGGLPRLDHLGEPEVDHLDEVTARAERLEDDVLGLEIAVDDAEVVRFGQRGERLAQHVEDAPDLGAALFVRDPREIAPAQKLHHQVELTVVGLAEIDHPHRVRDG